jgi:hypothetical protein
MSKTKPYDEEKEGVNVRKALELLVLNPAHNVSDMFNERSSLKKLKLPYTLDTADQSSFVMTEEATQDGCYLIYDSASGGTLVLHYSHEEIPENAVGFWAPGHGKLIRDFKFKGKGGYSELIRGIVGGVQNRKKYLSGWCQFIQLAKSLKGSVKKYPNPTQGLKVTIYGFIKEGSKVIQVNCDDQLVNVSNLAAVAVVYYGNQRFEGVHALAEVAFVEHRNLEGVATLLHD